MNNQEAFLAALEANEDDIATRLVYADWLEEAGETEEANRQRLWPAAKAWIVAFVEQHVREYYGDDDDDYRMDYAALMEEASAVVEDSDPYINCGPCENLQSALWSHGKEFWANWAIVTGKPSPNPENVTYGCAC